MSRKAVKWLYGELPKLVDEGILSEENAEKIKAYYNVNGQKMGRTASTFVFGLIGAVLIGLGIILLLGHNWDTLDRVSRAAISIGILVLAELIAGFVVKYKMDRAVWRESAATFLMLALGSSIALIGQTYHLSDDFAGFMYLWMLFSIPLPYLLRAHAPAVMYLVGSTVWLANTAETNSDKQWIWLLVAAFLPYYWNLLRSNRYANAAVITSWIFIICSYVWCGIAFSKYMGQGYLLEFACLFVITFFGGVHWFTDASLSVGQKSFKIIGFLGVVGISLVLTTNEVWRNLARHPLAIDTLGYFLLAAALAVVIRLSTLVVRRDDRWMALVAALPLLTVIGYLMGCSQIAISWIVLLFNVYFLSLSITFIIRAIRQTKQGELNIGMLMLAALILLRFFDINFSFILRGTVFIMLGGTFFAANLILSRRKKEGVK
ncbi:MAG: DUF2157 domain-containing protein [Pelosinus sp.]|nr:DUF2157 domain-containing protein [Pelosinus sp.]